MVFDVGVGEPAVSQEIELDVQGYVNHTRIVLDTLRSESRFNQFMAEASVITPNAWDAFERDFIAAGLCTLATQVVKSHVEMGFPAGDFGPITTGDPYHLDSVQTITSLYGEFKVGSVGRKYVWADYTNTVGRIVKVADEIRRGLPLQPAIDRWWLPMQRNDPSFEFFIAQRLQTLIQQRDEEVPPLWVIQEALFSGGQPPDWWAVIGEHQPDLQILDALFERAIQDRNDVVDLFGIVPDGQARARLLDLSWPNPSPNDLNWQFNVKAAFGDVQMRWALRRPYLDKSFVLSSVSSRSGNYLGSPLQLSRLSTLSGVTILDSAYAEEKQLLSMVACFPITAVFSALERTDVRVTSIYNTAERRNVWILRDFK